MKRSTWPTEYLIKSRTWTIEYVPQAHPMLNDDDDEELLGCCIAEQSKVFILEDQGLNSMIDTLFHELVHACHATAPMSGKVEDPEDREERIVLFATEAALEIILNAPHRWWENKTT